jgi:ATP-dependent DNA ligase
MAALRVKSITLDGEGVVCGPDGIADFDALRAAAGRKGSRRAFLYALDLLELDGVDLGRELWHERRKVLVRLLRRAVDGIRLSEHLDGADGGVMRARARRHRRKAAGSAISVGAHDGVGKDQNPGCASGDAGSRTL